MKRNILCAMALTLCMSMFTGDMLVLANAYKAQTAVSYNGKQGNFVMCNFNGYNYIKLRDFASFFINTKKEFDVTWDNTKKVVSIVTNKKYSSQPEVSFFDQKNTVVSKYTKSNASLQFDGTLITLESYNIEGNNYYKMRDLADYLQVNIEWVNDAKSIIMSPKDTTGATEIAMAKEIVELVNVERNKVSLNSLVMVDSVNTAAVIRSNEINAKFSHTRPNGSDPFTVLSELSIPYKLAGENIAIGQKSAKEVVTAWMNSEGHRDNILNPTFSHIGVGVVPTTSSEYDGYSFTQLFIQERDGVSLTAEKKSEREIETDLVTLINNEREKSGLQKLIVTNELTQAAQVRAVELNAEFSNTRPNGTKFSTVLDEKNIKNALTLEIIASKLYTAEEVFLSLSKDDSFKSEFLSEKFTHLGIGVSTYTKDFSGTFNFDIILMNEK